MASLSRRIAARSRAAPSPRFSAGKPMAGELVPLDRKYRAPACPSYRPSTFSKSAATSIGRDAPPGEVH